MRILIGVSVLAAALAAGCGSGQPSGDDAARAQMAQVQDAVTSAGVADLVGEVRWFEPETLFEQIDGQAVQYVDAGFLRMAHSEWRAPGGQVGAYVELEIYDMASPQGALDILAASRSATSAYLDVGNEAIQLDDGLELRVGRYYIRIVARKDVEGQKPLVQALAKAVVRAAPAGPKDDDLLAPLPAANRVAHTAGYTTKNFLNRDFLQQAREATYEVGGAKVRLFLVDARSPEKAAANFAEWKDSIPAQGSNLQASPKTFSYTEPFVGPTTVVVRGKFLAGAVGEPAAARPLLDSLLDRLE